MEGGTCILGCIHSVPPMASESAEAIATANGLLMSSSMQDGEGEGAGRHGALRGPDSGTHSVVSGTATPSGHGLMDAVQSKLTA